MTITEILRTAGEKESDWEGAKHFVAECKEQSYSRYQTKAIFEEYIGPQSWFDWLWKPENRMPERQKSRLEESVGDIQNFDIKQWMPEAKPVTINVIHQDKQSVDLSVFLGIVEAASEQLKNVKETISKEESKKAFNSLRKLMENLEEISFK